MERIQAAPGAFVTVLPGEKFKRSKIAVHLIVPGERQNATELALLPHILDRRCQQVPDPTALSRLLYNLYGADLTSESYTAGPCRVLTLGVSGLKNEFALGGEDLAAEYRELACNLLFAPLLENGAFLEEDVAIEKAKQADFLRSEMNDKRGYCLRQGRRKLYGASPLGIESSGYLEDMDAIDAKGLFAAWQHLLETAQLEVMVCGMDGQATAELVAGRLSGIRRAPVALPGVPPLAKSSAPQHFEEAMATTQGKLAIMATSGERDDSRGEAVMRMASALLGGLPTSRLFMNVREKQSLCYYCASSYGFFSGTLTMDSGVDHKSAARAAEAMLHELAQMQKEPVTNEELDNAKRYMRSVFNAAKDSPDALLNFAFNEWLKGTNRSLDEIAALCESVTATEVRDALARFAPAVEYRITEKEAV